MSRLSPRLLVSLALVSSLVLANSGQAQQISVDRGVRAAGLWCFPLVGDSSEYVYLPAAARLATDEVGAPRFSFVRYTSNVLEAKGGAKSLTSAGGGGVLHFIVELNTPDELVRAANSKLREIAGNDDANLRGPLVFAGGRYLLVSSIISPTSGSRERQLLASGSAPVLEGNRMALTFALEPHEASLLMESLEMATPDVSIVFDMAWEGLADSYDARLVVDWSEVHNSQAIKAGASVYFVSADVEAAFDELRRDQAIRLETSGSGDAMEALVSAAYSKLLDLLFRPVEPDEIPVDQQVGMAAAVSELLRVGGGDSQGRGSSGFGASVAYRFKEMNSSGLSVFDFAHRAAVERHSFITFNVGDVFRKHGDDRQYFRVADLDDPTFRQREILVSVDGSLLEEFDRLVNSATVTLRKRHAGGKETFRELVIDRRLIEGSHGSLSMAYGWKEDENQLEWLEYEIRTSWNFKGGGTYETDWQPMTAAVVSLFAPYQRQTIRLAGDLESLAERGVRAVVVEVEYPFFGMPRRQRLVARVGAPLDGSTIEATLPLGDYDYDYTITWKLQDNRSLVAHRSDFSGLVFIDDLPPL